MKRGGTSKRKSPRNENSIKNSGSHDDDDDIKEHHGHNRKCSRRNFPIRRILGIYFILKVCVASYLYYLYFYKNNFKEELPTIGAKDMISCRYDGHCPVLMTCSIRVKAGGNLPGFCEPIPTSQRQDEGASALETALSNFFSSSSSNTEKSTCLQQCQRELVVDEHYYNDKKPIIDETIDGIKSLGRPDGCALIYHRVNETSDEKNKYFLANDKAPPGSVEPSIRKWTSTRFRHVIRVDPLKPNDDYNEQWISYCYRPCNSDKDCFTKNDKEHVGKYKKPQGFRCNIDENQKMVSKVSQSGYCERNPDYWKNLNEEEEMLIVTAASPEYIMGLANLVSSAKFWAPNHKVVIYNLSRGTLMGYNEINSWTNVLKIEWKDGFPKELPLHAVLDLKTYAWKPIIMRDVFNKYKRSIFWLDAGSTLAGPITPAVDIAQRTGAFLVKGQDVDMTLSHPLTYQWFLRTKSTFRGGPHFSGNTQAWLYPSRYIKSIIERNAECAEDKDCIAPPNSDLTNHRYDQTSLSILCYDDKQVVPAHTEYLAAERRQLSPQFPKEPSFRFVWTSRSSYVKYVSIMKMSTTALYEEQKRYPHHSMDDDMMGNMK